MIQFEHIQNILKESNIDGWLLIDFRGSNSIAWDLLSIPSNTHCSRRWAVLIPKEGKVKKLVHAIEPFTLGHIPAQEIIYAGYDQWQLELQAFVKECPNIAIEYSPLCAIPTASKVDAGTVELLRSYGADIQSSADLLQQISAVWTSEQIEENVSFTAPILGKIMHETMDRIRESILKYGHADEFTIQQFVLQRFKDNKLFTYSPPIIARDRNAASPHYAPDENNSSTIHKDTTVLIDMWAKPAHGHGTYSDITWMCHTGNNPSELHKEIFSVIADARDAGISLIEKRLSSGIPIAGYEVDDAVRNHIIHKGFGEYFVHRTGHSITTETHGAGANMDNFETHDMRLLIPKTSFSIEPGIYINNQIGMRTEIDIVILEDGKPIITGLNPQKNLELLF